MRSATARASSCRKSNWRCSKTRGRRERPRQSAKPNRKTTPAWQTSGTGQSRDRKTPRQEAAAGGSRWRGIWSGERIVHDLAEAEKHCACCGKDLRLIAEETSERYEYIPASMKVIEDVRLKYACDCTVKTADKPAQPIEKSTAGASLLAQVIVAKFADHQPLHRQEKMFERHGVRDLAQDDGRMDGAGAPNCSIRCIRWRRRCCLSPR